MPATFTLDINGISDGPVFVALGDAVTFVNTTGAPATVYPTGTLIPNNNPGPAWLFVGQTGDSIEVPDGTSTWSFVTTLPDGGFTGPTGTVFAVGVRGSGPTTGWGLKFAQFVVEFDATGAAIDVYGTPMAVAGAWARFVNPAPDPLVVTIIGATSAGDTLFGTATLTIPASFQDGGWVQMTAGGNGVYSLSSVLQTP